MIYICSFKRGCKWPVHPDLPILNVTTCQRKVVKNLDLSERGLSLSPFFLKDYKGYPCFENFYQSLKFFEGMSKEQFIERRELWRIPKVSDGNFKHKKTDKWNNKKFLYTLYKDNKHILDNSSGFPVKRDYIETRKEIYYPLYKQLVKNSEVIKKWQDALVSQEKGVIVLDYDGPKDEDGNCLCLEFTQELFDEKINDPKFPFGHGYIVASLLNVI